MADPEKEEYSMSLRMRSLNPKQQPNDAMDGPSRSESSMSRSSQEFAADRHSHGVQPATFQQLSASGAVGNGGGDFFSNYRPRKKRRSVFDVCDYLV